VNSLESDNKIAIYHQIATTLKTRILNQIYTHGQLLPPEKELQKSFSTSNITIRKALGVLVKEGFVVRKRAIGTRVVFQEKKQHFIKFSGTFFEWYDTFILKVPYSVDVRKISRRRCSELIRSKLNLAKTDEIWLIKRIRKISNEPTSYYIDFFSTKLIENITKNDLLKHKSLIQIFQNRSGRKIDSFNQHVHASTADIDLAELLNIKFGDPIFFVETTFFSSESSPLLLSYWYFRGDRYTFTSKIKIDQVL
jgi:GntR family transcriptional regulator